MEFMPKLFFWIIIISIVLGGIVGKIVAIIYL